MVFGKELRGNGVSRGLSTSRGDESDKLCLEVIAFPSLLEVRYFFCVSLLLGQRGLLVKFYSTAIGVGEGGVLRVGGVVTVGVELSEGIRGFGVIVFLGEEGEATTEGDRSGRRGG